MIEGGVRPCGRVMAQLARGREAGRGVGWIRSGGVILLMARVAQRAGEVVVIVDVAIRALARRYRVHPRQREAGRSVVKLAVGPEHRVMAVFAGSWESGVRNGRGGARVVFLVARVAQRAGQVVVIVDVAICTLTRRSGMRSGQGEARAVVIECCIQP